MEKPSETLRRAIEGCGLTRYELAKRSGVTQSTLSRFIHGETGLSMAAIDALAAILGLELGPQRKRRKGE